MNNQANIIYREKLEKKSNLPMHIQKYYKNIDIVNKSFFFKGNNGKGILLIHGWTSTPYEMRALGEYLNKEGFSVYAPILSGHGTKPEDLENIIWKNWKSDVFKAYDKLSDECEQVFAGGMSFGGTLSLLLAYEKKVAGLILMSTPYKMRYQKIFRHLIRIITYLGKYKKKSYPRILGNSEMCLTQVVAYQRYPITSVCEAYHAIEVSLQKLNEITSPAIIIQSRDDHIISRNSMKALEKGLRSRFIKKRKIKNAYHNFIGDTNNEYIFDEIAEFVRECDK